MLQWFLIRLIEVEGVFLLSLSTILFLNSYTVTNNGFAARLTAQQAAELRANPAVGSVTLSGTVHLAGGHGAGHEAAAGMKVGLAVEARDRGGVV